jgi:hypothetical protein
MHTYLPGYRVGLNSGTAIPVGTADFRDGGSPTHLHLDLRNVAPLQEIQTSGTTKLIQAKNFAEGATVFGYSANAAIVDIHHVG